MIMLFPLHPCCLSRAFGHQAQLWGLCNEGVLSIWALLWGREGTENHALCFQEGVFFSLFSGGLREYFSQLSCQRIYRHMVTQVIRVTAMSMNSSRRLHRSSVAFWRWCTPALVQGHQPTDQGPAGRQCSALEGWWKLLKKRVKEGEDKN